jgi:signal transduction histidine kinase
VRIFEGAVVILVALAAIVGLSLSSATVGQERLLAEFTEQAGQQVHSSAEALSHLDSVHQDLRVLVGLVERSRQDPELDAAAARRVWESAFRALAVVVNPYRIISFVGGDGAIDVVAVDPRESRAAADMFLPRVRSLGLEANAKRVETLGEAIAFGGRSFLVYATPVQGGGAIVVVSDTSLLLSSVAWPQLSSARLFVTDPAAVVWAGCETAGGCRTANAQIVPRGPQGAGGSAFQIDAAGASRLGLYPAPAICVSASVSRPTGSWIVTWIASTQPILKREQSSLSRIVGTAIAAAIVVAVVGMILLRQERRAGELANQLRYANAVAEARELENQLVRADRLITVGVMATEIAHEVGTPLAVVRGRAEQVLPEVGPGRAAENLRVIIKHVDQISSTIRNLLDFSRRAPLDKRAVSLASIVDHTRELLQVKIEARRLQLKIDLSDDLPLLTADSDQLQQVLVNLLLNACDASKPGESVAISARPASNEMVRIEVVDRGAGIPSQHLAAVFEPFFTTKPRGAGTGLGLSIAAGIVRNHAGRIDLQSTEGEGTTVTVLWPASSPQEEIVHV